MSDTPNRPRESERRRATILFADISGFTAMSERMDPEEVTVIMNDCFRMMGAIVSRHEGTIDKFIGDCMMALFGVPVAVEDAPWKAVNAAIEIRNGLERINLDKKTGSPLSVHIGINTGTVVAGSLGTDEKKDYTVMGAPVNYASRLKDAAGKGRIFVGPLTFRVTRNDFAYAKRDFVSLKSGCKTFPVFEVLSVRGKSRPARSFPGHAISSPMVGRDGELRRLEALVHRAMNGDGSIVSITGDAGIGKSRLMAELKKRQSIRGVAFLEGQALSAGTNLSFHPVVDLLQRWAGIEKGESEAESTRKLKQGIEKVFPEGAAEVYPFVATLMGMKLTGGPAERTSGISGEALEKLILMSIRRVLTKLAERGPVVFVMEDLHWADRSSLKLLEALYALAQNSPLLFINIFRPDYADTGERFLSALRERYGALHAELRLEHLDEEQCNDLMCNLLMIKGPPGRIEKLIRERAEGNPFFIEEVVRSFIDNGVVKMKNGTFEVTDKIDSAVIPSSIQNLLMSRIDKLDEQTRTLMKYASVIGRSFYYRILAEVAGSIDEINAKLDYLKEIQLIRERKRMTELEYLFKHALVQEAAYESILLSQRKKIHLQIAGSIERLFPGRLREFYGMLALHYSRAEELVKAEEYLASAGEESLKASASSEALYYYREALRLYLDRHSGAADPEKIAGLEKNIALALHNKGRYAEAIEHFDRVLECWRVRNPANGFHAAQCAGNFLGVMKTLYLPWGRRPRQPDRREAEIINVREKRALALAQTDTKRLFTETLAILNELNRFDLATVENGASIYLEGCAVFCFSGVSFSVGKRILDHAKDHIDRTDARSAFYYRFNKFLHDYLSGNWHQMEDYSDESVDRCLKIGELYHVSVYTMMFGLLQTERGDFKAAQHLTERLRTIAELYDHDYSRGAAYLLNALLLLKQRRLSDAVKEAEAGISFLTKNGQEQLALFASAIKINAQILLQGAAAAEHFLISAENFVHRKKWVAPFYTGNLAISRSLHDHSQLEAAVKRGDRRRTRECRATSKQSARAAVRNAAKYAANKTEAERLMGVHFWLCGRQDAAMKWFEKSIETGERAGARPELARTYLEAGSRLLEKASARLELNGMKAGEYLLRAETLFHDMGLEWDLKELEKVREAGPL
jgi:class 3 adenylate cyclase/tetratricopeptide (TPR) repeat protein